MFNKIKLWLRSSGLLQLSILIDFYTFNYHVFAPMGRFQLELMYLYFPPSFHLTVVVSVL